MRTGMFFVKTRTFPMKTVASLIGNMIDFRTGTRELASIFAKDLKNRVVVSEDFLDRQSIALTGKET